MKTNLFLTILMVLSIVACNKDNELGKDPSGYGSNPIRHTVDIVDESLTNVVGSSTLLRQKDGVSAQFKTSTLIPGHAYTLWWVIWNKPENCAGAPGPCLESDFGIADQVEVEILYASGQVVGSNGQTTFSAHLKESDTNGSINDLFGLPSFGGLQDAQQAEVHLVLRSHGPKIPGQINNQISSYGGGCTVNFPAFSEVPDEVGECADIHASIHQAN